MTGLTLPADGKGTVGQEAAQAADVGFGLGAAGVVAEYVGLGALGAKDGPGAIGGS
jgi:hypothetical protein